MNTLAVKNHPAQRQSNRLLGFCFNTGQGYLINLKKILKEGDILSFKFVLDL